MFKKKVIYLTIISLLFILPSFTYAAVNPDFTPQWHVGDSWDTVIRSVGGWEPGFIYEGPTEIPGSPLYIHFEVADLKEIDGEMCYIIQITYKNPTNEYDRNAALQLYVRQDDFTLKKLMELIKQPDGSMDIDHFHTQDNVREFVIFRRPFSISIHLDFPNLSATNTNEERAVQESPDHYPETQRIIFLDANTMKVELSTPNNNGILTVTQIWERGKPWWSSCKREFTYKDYETGEMKTGIEADPLLLGTDTTPPVLQLSVTPTTLWPPNHEMVEITPTISVSDNYDRYPDVKFESVTSNEPDDTLGEGDGHTTQDIQTTEVWDSKERKMMDKISLRAECTGEGSGRIYTITYSATDASGNKSTTTATVTVPHDQGKK